MLRGHNRMKYETAKEKFERKLRYGQDRWIAEAYNDQDKQVCPYGCIIVRRVAPPLYYNLRGDCRCPSADDCCMNLQYNAEYHETRAIEKAK